MTEFWIFGAQLLAVALVFVVWPLWRGAARNNAVVRDAANLEIFRDQVAEMDADLANGLLTPELHAQGRRELEARLLDEVKSPGAAGGAAPRNPLRILALVLVIVIPAASVGLYWKLGNPNVFLPRDQHVALEGMGGVLNEDGIKELKDRLAKNPNVPDDWLLLARSYSQLGQSCIEKAQTEEQARVCAERWTDSAKAYQTLSQLVPNEAEVWAEYADVLAMVHNQSLAGPPTALLDKALALDPNNQKALALSGAAAMERGDYPAAVRHWENLLTLLPPGSQNAEMIQGGLAQARDFLARSKGGKPTRQMAQTMAGQGQPDSPAKERISGTVTLGDPIRAKAAPDDTVFILARAADGPPMPLAVIRKQVKDLPFQFALDDSVAVMPQAKLSDFNKVVVVARVSKSGDAMPHSGDLQGVSGIVKPGASRVMVTIDSAVK